METLRYVLLANGLLAVVSLTYYVLLRRETFFWTNRLGQHTFCCRQAASFVR